MAAAAAVPSAKPQGAKAEPNALVRFFAYHGTILLTLALAFAAWIITLGGLSAVQKYCDGNSCEKRYRFQWWALWLELFTLLLMLAVVVSGALKQCRPALVGFLAVTTILWMDQTNYFLGARESANGSDFDATSAAFGGFLLGTLFNLVLVYLTGVESDE